MGRLTRKQSGAAARPALLVLHAVGPKPFPQAMEKLQGIACLDPACSVIVSVANQCRMPRGPPAPLYTPYNPPGVSDVPYGVVHRPGLLTRSVPKVYCISYWIQWLTRSWTSQRRYPALPKWSMTFSYRVAIHSLLSTSMALRRFPLLRQR